MSEQEKLQRGKRRTKIILITVTVLFIVLMLVVPLISVITSALKEGFKFYIQSITTEYVISALGVTLIATVIAVVVNTFFGICAAWLLTKFSFKGKQVLATLIDIPFSISPVIVGLAYLMTFGRLGWTYPAIRWINDMLGTNIRITFAVPGVVLATIFVTFPFVSRELIPVLNAQGKDEEEAPDADLSVKTMFIMAVATSIDALAVGISLAMAGVSNIYLAVLLIGLTTFVLSAVGVKVGTIFGSRYEKKAEVVGGIILILLGFKILLEHLGVLG